MKKRVHDEEMNLLQGFDSVQQYHKVLDTNAKVWSLNEIKKKDY